MNGRDDLHLKEAFGKTPDSLKNKISLILENEPQNSIPFKKPVSVKVLLCAVLLILLSCAAGFALSMRFNVMSFFSDPEDNAVNEEAQKGVHPLHAVYEGEYVRVSMNDGLYDAAGNTFAFSYTVENLQSADNLYILADAPVFGGKPAFIRSYRCYSHFVLPKELTECGVQGELPLNNTRTDCAVTFYVLQSTLPLKECTLSYQSSQEMDESIDACLAQGFIPVERDGYIPVPGRFQSASKDYKTALLDSGKMVLKEQFTLDFSFEKNLLDEKPRVYDGQKIFAFQDCALHILDLVTTPTSLRMKISYTADKPIYEWPHSGPSWHIELKDADTKSGFFYKNAGGEWGDIEKLPNGQYRSAYFMEARELTHCPEKLILQLITFDRDGNRTVHEDAKITLNLN